MVTAVKGSRLVYNGYAENSLLFLFVFFQVSAYLSVFYSCSLLLYYFPIIPQSESALFIAQKYSAAGWEQRVAAVCMHDLQVNVCLL